MRQISKIERCTNLYLKIYIFDIHTTKNDIERYDTIILLLNLYFAFLAGTEIMINYVNSLKRDCSVSQCLLYISFSIYKYVSSVKKQT